jgi:hypothetical protein
MYSGKIAVPPVGGGIRKIYVIINNLFIKINIQSRIMTTANCQRKLILDNRS